MAAYHWVYDSRHLQATLRLAIEYGLPFSGISSQISSPKQKTTTEYRLLVWSFSLASITDVMSIFRRQPKFFMLFLLAAAKSALSILRVKYRVF